MCASNNNSKKIFGEMSTGGLPQGGVSTTGVTGLPAVGSYIHNFNNDYTLIFSITKTGQPGVLNVGGQPGVLQPANIVQGTSTTNNVADDSFSQAESSIKNGEVVASAQGTKNGGTAQTQVQGTYSGTGSFSASAQTADKDRSAQAQVRIKY